MFALSPFESSGNREGDDDDGEGNTIVCALSKNVSSLLSWSVLSLAPPETEEKT